MKVKEIMKKVISVRSNCNFFVQDGLFGELIELTKEDVKNLTPEHLMDMTVNGMTITDNVFTFHTNFNK